jgi:hypothetical protein
MLPPLIAEMEVMPVTADVLTVASPVVVKNITWFP